MRLWITVLAASGLCYLFKLTGYLAPQGWLERPRVARIAAMLTVSLLSALVVVQTFGRGRGLVVDARVVALGAATVALLLRAPFIVVVLVAAVTAAAIRAAGWG